MDILEIWPLALCVLQIVLYFILGLFLISLNEFPRRGLEGEHKEVDDFTAKVTERPIVRRQETWQAWAGALHPGWLLGLRVFAFLYLFGLWLVIWIETGSWFWFFNYYTEWTLTLCVVYFAWATLVSLIEVQQNVRKHHQINDVEVGDLQSSFLGAEGPQDAKAGYLGYTLQILFQIVAPAVILTDGVYWTLLYPFFPEDFPHTFSEFNVHFLNAVFLVVEILLNSMRFPWFRAAYFFVYSCLYVFFQWSIHVFGQITNHWPYPFMDVSTNLAPVWYLALGLLHITAYAIAAFFNRLKLVLQDTDENLSSRARLWSLAQSLWPGGTQ